MYLQYCIPSFKDTMNFNTRRYLKMPEIRTIASREERALNRFVLRSRSAGVIRQLPLHQQPHSVSLREMIASLACYFATR